MSKRKSSLAYLHPGSFGKNKSRKIKGNPNKENILKLIYERNPSLITKLDTKKNSKNIINGNQTYKKILFNKSWRKLLSSFEIKLEYASSLDTQKKIFSRITKHTLRIASINNAKLYVEIQKAKNEEISITDFFQKEYHLKENRKKII